MLQPSRFCQLTPGGHGGRRDSMSSALCHVMFAAFDVLFDRLFHHLVELAVFLDRDALQVLDQVHAESLSPADASNTQAHHHEVMRLCAIYIVHFPAFAFVRFLVVMSAPDMGDLTLRAGSSMVSLPR